MKPCIYIDGKSGTTGLQIYERLQKRDDVNLLLIDPEKRHDPKERGKLMDTADIVFLCLPDAAAREAVTLVRSETTRIIDASTAHRTNPVWTYGFPELKVGQLEAIANAKRVANPGCHATGFLSSAAPLVQMGILPNDYPVTCYSLTGYSGGGKQMIDQYENHKTDEFDSPRLYGLTLQHKHLPEMQKIAGLTHPPVFNPVVDNYYKGMMTTLLLHNGLLNGTPSAADVCEQLQHFYEGQPMVTVTPFGENEPLLAANAMAGKDTLNLTVCGNEQQTIITAQFDNLGKGASGAAVQNMNLMLGLPETTGLSL